ncbi:MAG: protein kinase domain-containing protein [Chthoniobacterales bacterium]
MLPAFLTASLCAACGEPVGEDGTCIPCLLRVGLGDEERPSDTCFGDFEIERLDDGSLWELGRGATGVTYRAQDNVLNRAVALKVIETANSQPVRERFLREARSAAGLRHPNIATVFQFGASTDGERCYCAMELVDGETLEALVRRAGPLYVLLVLEIAIQVTRALLAATERGLVHRDLKPGNIMLGPSHDPADLQIKVIDFGLAKAVNLAGEMELTYSGFAGTPAFASPEQFAHGSIDARTDIYALGVTIWYALTGRLPFAGTSIEEIRACQAKMELPNEQLSARGGIPPSVVDLLRSCLAFDAAKRPASARDLMAALATCRAEVAKPRHGRRLVFAAVCCAMVATVLAGWWWRDKSLTPATPTTSLEDPNPPLKATDNGQAYLLFLRARDAELNGSRISEALEFYQQAIALDPKFALARARFAIRASVQGYENDDASLRLKARAEAKQALRLQPDLGEAHLARASCYLNVENDASQALAELNRAAALLPRSAEVQLTAAFVHKRQNRLRERIAALRRAEAIDPRDTQVRSLLSLSLRWARDWKQAIEALDRRTIAFSGNNSVTSASAWFRASDEFRMSGDIEVLKQALASDEERFKTEPEWLNGERFEIAMFERDYERAAHVLSEMPAERSVLPHGTLFQEALLAIARGADARERAERSQRAEAAAGLAAGEGTGSDAPRGLADLAIIHAFSGRKEDAVREAKRAVDRVNTAPGSIEKNAISSALALVYAQTGQTEQAIDMIEHLLSVPCELQDGRVYNMTLVDLKWRWIWDPLRGHPRFQKLLAGPEPKTIY